MYTPLLFWLVASAFPATPDVFTVDDDGPADFAGIAEAIASPLVADGDVLLVEPGDYGGFTLTKTLDVVAAAVGGVTVGGLTSVADVERFALVGLSLAELRVERVPGRARVEDVAIGGYGLADGYPSYWLGLLEVVDCGALVVSRTTAHGDDACYPDGPGDAGPAVRVVRSNATFVDCEFQGGQGTGFGDACYEHYPTAGAGMQVLDGSRVLVSGSTLRGGHGPWETAEPAIRVENASVEVRGTLDDVLAGPLPSQAFVLTGACHVTVSGVTLASLGLPPEVVVLDVPRPSLRAAGPTAPGATFAVELFGPAGAPAWLAVGFAGDPLPFGLDPVPLLVGPTELLALLPLTASGPELPTVWSAALPTDPALAGLGLALQALVDAAPPRPPLLTAPVDLTLRR